MREPRLPSAGTPKFLVDTAERRGRQIASQLLAEGRACDRHLLDGLPRRFAQGLHPSHGPWRIETLVAAFTRGRDRAIVEFRAATERIRAEELPR